MPEVGFFLLMRPTPCHRLNKNDALVAVSQACWFSPDVKAVLAHETGFTQPTATWSPRHWYRAW